VTQDVGLGAGFDGALSGRIGPFLLPATAPGGAELPAIGGPVPGKLYVADPARLGPVTGSPIINPADNLPQNYFRIVGPGVNVGTNNFSLMGRVFTGAIPGRLTIDRASYALPQVNAAKLDVFATAFPTTQGRVPGQPPAAVTAPLLAFLRRALLGDAAGTLGAPAGVAGQQMLNDGSSYYAQDPVGGPAAGGMRRRPDCAQHGRPDRADLQPGVRWPTRSPSPRPFTIPRTPICWSRPHPVTR
jgi:hypothetical protein